MDKLSHVPDILSCREVTQLAQRAESGTFEKWDYHLTNLIHYGTLTPPKYDISKITNPYIVLMIGENDNLGDPRDVDIMRKQLKGKYIYLGAMWINIYHVELYLLVKIL